MIKNIFDMKSINYDKHSSGEFSERLKNDPENIAHMLTIVQYNIFNIITDILILIYIFYINFIIGTIFLISIIIIYIYEKYAYKNLEKIIQEGKTLNDRNSTLLNETMRGIRDIKYLDLRYSIFNMVSNSLDSTNNNNINKSIKTTKIYETTDIIKIITIFIIIVVGIVLINKEMLTLTNFLIIYMYRTEVLYLIYSFSSIKIGLLDYKVASNRILEITDPNKFPKEQFGNTKLNNIKGKIEIKNLSFAYGKKKVLKDINLLIKPNDAIGIVGASGG